MNITLFDIEEAPAESKTSNEWYTPPRILEAVRAVLKVIELDPAGCEASNRTVKAQRFLTKEQNGLMYPWPGRIFLNPPYGKTSSGGSNLAYFTRYLIEQYECGNTQEAILLIPANTATSWFEPLWGHAICFPVTRLRFLKEDGSPSDGVSFGTCLVYLGSNAERFIEVFLQFGPVVTPNGVYRREKPVQTSLWVQEVEVAL